MHNNIMAAGSRDCPPMLATGRYPQWKSRFLRYIDTRPNGDALRKCILKGPYQPTTVTILVFLQNILDLYFKHFKLSEDVVNRILQVILDLQHFKSSLFIFAATILQSSSAIHHISNIDNYVHQIIKFQSILITSSHSLWSSQSFGHQKGVCPWLTENHFNSQYLKHWASQSFGT
ncbi:hypothetical protein Tco_0799129 [Tanacetum coccineum]